MSDSNLDNTGFFNQVTATLDYKPEIINFTWVINENVVIVTDDLVKNADINTDF